MLLWVTGVITRVVGAIIWVLGARYLGNLMSNVIMMVLLQTSYRGDLCVAPSGIIIKYLGT